MDSISGVRKGVLKSSGFLGVMCMLCLVGCNSIKVKLGRRLYIAQVPMTSMDVSMPKNPAGVAPGEQSPLVLKFTQPDGTVLMSEGQGKGKVLWSDIVVTPTVVSVNKKGVVSTPHDPRTTDGKTGHVTITVPSHPDLKAELDIPLRYDYGFSASFSGDDGSRGFNGISGTDGFRGSDGSVDATNPSAGGNGTPGGNGTSGTNGRDGGDGPNIAIRATMRSGTLQLVELVVTAARSKERYFLIDPQGGTLSVSTVGGSGGQGGKGGSGGRGGSGGNGIPPGFKGSDGFAGNDGRKGDDGRGGSITVTYDPQVKPFLGLIHLSNQGGPAPVFKEETVAPLW